MDFLQPGVGDVGIYLGGSNRRMPEKFLDGPDVRAVGKQRGGERMPERMGRNVLYDTGLEGTLGDRGRYEVARQPDVVGFERLFFSRSNFGTERFFQFLIYGIPVFVLRFFEIVGSVVMPDKERSEVVMTGFEIL